VPSRRGTRSRLDWPTANDLIVFCCGFDPDYQTNVLLLKDKTKSVFPFILIVEQSAFESGW
jgi:hypothetical protein